MNRTQILEKPEALLITMSKENVVEWGGLELIDRFFQFNYRDGSDETFWYKIGSNLPKFEVMFVYIVIHNTIRWRFNFVGYEQFPRNGPGITLWKNGIGHRYWGNFVVLCGPSIKMPEELTRRGFQGFRYSEILF